MSNQWLREHTSSEEAAMVYLRSKNVLSKEAPLCPQCSGTMTEVSNGKVNKTWRCPRHKGQKKSIRLGSYWSKSHLTLAQILELVHAWAHRIPSSSVVELTSLNEKTILQWFSYFIDICSNYLSYHPRLIGGRGVIVQVDESLARKEKIPSKKSSKESCIVGAFCPTTKEGFLYAIPDNSASTLLPIVLDNVAPGSIIHSHSVEAFANGNITNLPADPPYEHRMIGPSENFICPITGGQTNYVEYYWRIAKRQLRNMSGIHNNQLGSHLDEFMWREQFGKTAAEAIENLLLHLSMWYITK